MIEITVQHHVTGDGVVLYVNHPKRGCILRHWIQGVHARDVVVEDRLIRDDGEYARRLSTIFPATSAEDGLLEIDDDVEPHADASAPHVNLI